MILKEMMLDSLQSAALPVQPAISAPSGKTGGGQTFADVLDNTVKASKNGDETSNVRQDKTKAQTPGTVNTTEDNDQSAETGPKIKTYREAKAEADRRTAKAGAGKDAKTEQTDDSDGSKKKDASKVNAGENGGAIADNVINCLAQALGLSQGDFRQLLKEAGITPEELASGNIDQVTQKLSALLGLDCAQSKTLSDLIGMAKSQALEINGTVDTQPAGGLTADAASGTLSSGIPENMGNTAASPGNSGPEIEITSTWNNVGADFSGIVAKMKLKLNELKDGADGNTEGLAAGMTAKPDTAQDTDASQAPAAGTEDVKTAAVQDNGKMDMNADGGKDSSSSKDSKGEGKAADGIKPAVEAAIKVDAAKTNDAGLQTAPIDAQLQKAADTLQIDRVDVRTPVQAKEIINQVLEKAKVVLTGDKSEMVMDLKPDNLGKVSLKVVTENGIVQAKFVAENQQVKQVLESNMQLLKDSLEKQGMNVQGFSVSVRQDTRQGYSNQNEAALSKNSAPRRTSSGTERIMAAADRLVPAEIRNPYARWDTNTVNFTA